MSSDVSLTNLELEFSENVNENESIYLSLKPRFSSERNSSFYISENIGGVDDANTTSIGSTFISTLNFDVGNIVCSGIIKVADGISLSHNGNIEGRRVSLQNSKGFNLYNDHELVTKLDTETYLVDKYYSKELSNIRFVTYSNVLSQISLYDLQNSNQVSNIVSQYVTNWFASTHYITDVNIFEQIEIHDLISSSYLNNYILTNYDNFNDHVTLSNIHEISPHVQGMIEINNQDYFDKDTSNTLFVTYSNVFSEVSNVTSLLQLTNEAYVNGRIQNLDRNVAESYYLRTEIDSKLLENSANVDQIASLLSDNYYTKQNIDALFTSNDISDFEFFQNSIATSLRSYYDKSNVDDMLTAHQDNIATQLSNLETDIHANVTEVRTELTDLRNDTQILESNIVTLDSQVSSLQGDVANLDANIKSVSEYMVSEFYDKKRYQQ